MTSTSGDAPRALEEQAVALDRRRLGLSLPEPLARFATKLAFELLVVFAGVTLAFLAENSRQASQRKAQARQIYAALAAELSDHTTVGQQVLDRYVARQGEWDAAFSRGERPIPWYIPWSNAGPPRGAWDATVSSGGISLIERPLFYELAKYYRLVDVYMTPVDGPDPFVDAEIIPHLQEGPSAFYVTGKHQLTPRYQAYLDRRRLLLTGDQSAINRGRALLAELKSRAGGQIATAHP